MPCRYAGGTFRKYTEKLVDCDNSSRSAVLEFARKPAFNGPDWCLVPSDRLTHAGENQMKPYFAYGSNLWRKQMEVRCPDHRVIGTGVLTGYRWIITMRGYASVVRSAGDLVLGVVYAISEPDEERLDNCEVAREGGYRKTLLQVDTGRGEMVCLLYIDPREQEGEPSEEYIERMHYGICDAGLPSLYVDRYLDKIVNRSEPYAHAG